MKFDEKLIAKAVTKFGKRGIKGDVYYFSLRQSERISVTVRVLLQKEIKDWNKAEDKDFSLVVYVYVKQPSGGSKTWKLEVDDNGDLVYYPDSYEDDTAKEITEVMEAAKEVLEFLVKEVQCC